MTNRNLKNKDYILAEVLNHDKGPKCPDCGKPLTVLRAAEDVKPLRKGDELLFCFKCDSGDVED